SAILWAIALCLVKEDASLYVLAFAIAVAVGRTFSVPVAAVLALAAVSVLVIDLKIVQPWQLGWRPPGYGSFWSGYGASPGEVLVGALRHPLRATVDVVTSRWWTVLGPALFLPLLQPTVLLTMAPGLLMLGLASNEAMRNFQGYYPVPIACLSIVGIVCFALRHRARTASFLPLLAALLFPLFGGYFRIHRPAPDLRRGLAEVRSVVSSIAHPVCVQTGILPQLPYSSWIEPLDPSCRDRPGAVLLLNPDVDPWPDRSDELRQLVSRAVARGTARQFPGGFALIPPPETWP